MDGGINGSFTQIPPLSRGSPKGEISGIILLPQNYTPSSKWVPKHLFGGFCVQKS